MTFIDTIQHIAPLFVNKNLSFFGNIINPDFCGGEYKLLKMQITL